MKKVLVPLAQGCEELEAVTIIDLLRRADIDVVTASLDQSTESTPVVASRGVVLVADTTLDQAMNQDFDMIILPGGLPGADHLNNDQRIHQLLKQVSEAGKYTAAICAAPKVLADAQLLNNKSATSYPGVLDSMNLKETKILEQSVVVDEKVITSKGPATAMEFALTLIAVLLGDDKRNEVAKGLLYS